MGVTADLEYMLQTGYASYAKSHLETGRRSFNLQGSIGSAQDLGEAMSVTGPTLDSLLKLAVPGAVAWLA